MSFLLFTTLLPGSLFFERGLPRGVPRRGEFRKNELVEEHRPELIFSLCAFCFSISDCLFGRSWRRLEKVREGWRTSEEVGRVEKVRECWRGSWRKFLRKFGEQVGTSRREWVHSVPPGRRVSQACESAPTIGRCPRCSLSRSVSTHSFSHLFILLPSFSLPFSHSILPGTF